MYRLKADEETQYSVQKEFFVIPSALCKRSYKINKSSDFVFVDFFCKEPAPSIPSQCLFFNFKFKSII